MTELIKVDEITRLRLNLIKQLSKTRQLEDINADLREQLRIQNCENGIKLNLTLLDSIIAELKSSCNRYINGECNSLTCLKQGGYQRGSMPDYSKATCERHKQVMELEALILDIGG